MAIPENLEHLEKFGGLVGYYRQYIKDILRRVNEILKEKKFSRTPEDEKIFQEVKNKFKGDQILGIFDFEEEVMVHKDTSSYAIGTEISQLDEEDQFSFTPED
jgi:hypothetical protein